MAGISAQVQSRGSEGYVRAGGKNEPMLCVKLQSFLYASAYQLGETRSYQMEVIKKRKKPELTAKGSLYQK